MKTGLSLTDLARKIESNKELKRDYVMDTSRLTMQVMPATKIEAGGPSALLLRRRGGRARKSPACLLLPLPNVVSEQDFPSQLPKPRRSPPGL